MMKKISIADPKKEFEDLTKIGQEFAKKRKVKTEDDVVKKIHEGRRVKH